MWEHSGTNYRIKPTFESFFTGKSGDWKGQFFEKAAIKASADDAKRVVAARMAYFSFRSGRTSPACQARSTVVFCSVVSMERKKRVVVSMETKQRGGDLVENEKGCGGLKKE